MADDENEPDRVPASREPPPRAVTRLSALVRRLVAPNASPFTFNGTCTYIVGEGKVAIVDPGPDDDAHLAALSPRSTASRSRPFSSPILTAITARAPGSSRRRRGRA